MHPNLIVQERCIREELRSVVSWRGLIRANGRESTVRTKRPKTAAPGAQKNTPCTRQLKRTNPAGHRARNVNTAGVGTPGRRNPAPCPWTRRWRARPPGVEPLSRAPRRANRDIPLAEMRDTEPPCSPYSLENTPLPLSPSFGPGNRERATFWEIVPFAAGWRHWTGLRSPGSGSNSEVIDPFEKSTKQYWRSPFLGHQACD